MIINIKAQKLNREEVQALMNWCDCQTEDLWEGMTLQEILNVWHASSEWDLWEGWAEEDRQAAHKAWNKAVRDPLNKMVAL